MTRTFEVAESCLNCQHREYRSGRYIICDIDKKWRNERIKCSEYVKTTNKNILSSEPNPLTEMKK